MVIAVSIALANAADGDGESGCQFVELECTHCEEEFQRKILGSAITSEMSVSAGRINVPIVTITSQHLKM